jgi:hypothetical protein
MLVRVSPEEEVLMQILAHRRAETKKDSRLTVSRMTPYTSALMGITGEYLIARTLGMLFNPDSFKGGDGHRRDLWRGEITASVKTRGRHLPADFLFPPGQHPGTFPDDYGVVGRWIIPYRVLDIVGFFDRLDWKMHHTTLTTKGVKPGTSPYRDGYPEQYLRNIDELIVELEMTEDEEVRTVQNHGYFEYFRDRCSC